MRARVTLLVLTVGIGLLFLPGCENEYGANVRYTFRPYPSKASKTITIERTADGRVVELDADGKPAVTPSVAEPILVAYAAELNLQPGEKKGKGVDVKDVFTVDAARAAELDSQLLEYFGTPRDPIVKVDEEIVNSPEMRLQPEHLKKGSQLYRRLCLYCHGLVGDGMGPTGQFLDPRPRDFRQGKFKFRSTAKYSPESEKFDAAQLVAPSFEDIRQTLRRGVPTASMPSFNLLADEDLDALVSYVIHLSLRGQSELKLAKGEADDVEQAVTSSAKNWLYGSPRGGPQNVQKKAITVPTPPSAWGEAARTAGSFDASKGRKIYLGDGGCVECHAKDGRSNPLDLPTNLNRRNDWGDLVVPRNLSHGVYRGGARPVDIYWRIKLGILPSGMPAASDKLTDEDIWHLVEYVLSVPTQQR